MLLLEAPVFSLTREIVIFAIFVAFVIAVVLATEIEFKRAVEKEAAKIARPQDSDFFNKIEEFRNDFGRSRKTS